MPSDDPPFRRPPVTARWALRTIVLVVGGLFVLAAILAVGLLLAVQSGRFDGMVQARLAVMAGRPIVFRHMRARLLTTAPIVEFDDLAIGSPPGITQARLLTAARAVVRIRLGALMKGDPHLFDVRLDDPAAHLVRLGRGRNNYTLGSGGASGGWGRLARLRIDDGIVIYEDSERHAVLRARITHAADGVGARILHLTGAGEINDGAFTVDAWGASLANRGSSAPYPFSAVVDDGAVRVRLQGTSGRPFDFRKLDVTLQASGPNLADFTYLFAAPAPNSAPFQLAAHLVRDQPRLRMTDIVGQIGDTDLAGTLASDHPPGGRRTIQATFYSRRLHLRDVRAALSPRPAHAQTRAASGILGVRGLGGRLFSDKPFNTEALRRGDLDLRITADQAPDAALKVRALSARLIIRGGRLTLDPLTFSADPGEVGGRLLLDARQTAPRVAFHARVRGARLATLKPGLAAVADARVDADLDLAGRGRSLHAAASNAQGRLALRLQEGRLQTSKAAALGGDLVKAIGLAVGDKAAQSPLTCAVADFQATAGRLEVHDLAIVTAAGSTRGAGAVDLAGETLGITLQGTPTHPRPFQVNAPIHVNGPLAHPTVRPGVVTGLDRLVAALPFGRRKASMPACDALLRQSELFGREEGHPDD